MKLLHAISPIEQMATIDTPMMIVESEAERDDGWSNARSFFNGLRVKGVEASMVYYPTFHNGGWTDAYKRDYMQRLLAWFNYCLKGESLPEWFEEGEG